MCLNCATTACEIVRQLNNSFITFNVFDTVSVVSFFIHGLSLFPSQQHSLAYSSSHSRHIRHTTITARTVAYHFSLCIGRLFTTKWVLLSHSTFSYFVSFLWYKIENKPFTLICFDDDLNQILCVSDFNRDIYDTKRLLQFAMLLPSVFLFEV